MSVPVIPDGTVCANPTTASWAMTARGASLSGEAETIVANPRTKLGMVKSIVKFLATVSELLFPTLYVV